MNVTIVDTPGFGADIDEIKMSNFFKEMKNLLTLEVQTADAIVLHFKSEGFTRFDKYLKNGILELTHILGVGAWKNMIINVG